MISLTKLLNTFCILPHFFLKFLKFKIILREIHYLCNIEGTPQNRTQSNVKNIHFGPILSPKKNSKPITD